MENFKPITTQEEFDARISDRIKREKETIEKALAEKESEITSLKLQVGEREEALQKSIADVESLQKTIEETNGKLSQHETAKLKTSIALKNGIPFDLAERLSGTTEEEITADAQRFAEFVSKPSVIAPPASTEPRGSDYSSRDAELLNISKSLTNRGE